ncbi:MAG: sulfatase [Candidatus Eisenbacteria bacterium]|nr:sulfatase [Candidatus Eisenbacteria bacterium]
MSRERGERTGGLSWILWILAGLFAGGAAGALDSLFLTRVLSSLSLPSYFVLLTAIQYGILGGAAGLILWPLLAVFPGGRRLHPHPFAVLLPLLLLVAVTSIGNRHYLPEETAPASLLFDGLAILLSVALGIAIARVGRRLPRLTAGRAAIFTFAAAGALFGLLSIVPGSAGRTIEPSSIEGGNVRGRPNLLILMIDTLRNDHVSWNDYPRRTTPRLDRFVERGTVFTHLVSQAPHTKESCATLLTGLYPSTHTAVEHDALPESAHTLAEDLQGRGYRTFCSSANTYISPVFGFDQGFETLVTLPVITTYKNGLGHALLRGVRRFGPLPVVSTGLDLLISIEKRLFWEIEHDAAALAAPEVIDPFLDWIGENDKEPFFAYLHFLEPHATYEPPAPYDALFSGGYDGDPVIRPPSTAGVFAPANRARALPEAERRNMIDRYDGEIAYLDEEIGRLIDAIETRGLIERTLIVVVADHGETFYEHGSWGHGHSLYEEELRVPFALIRPGSVPSGRRIDSMARMVDVMPTLLDLLGLDPPEGMQGSSFAGLLEGRGAGASSSYSEIQLSGRRYDTLRKGNYKLIRSEDGGAWLYDLEKDPGEHEDLFEELPDRASELLAEIESLSVLFRGARLTRSEKSAELDATTMDRLRALGYIE